MNTPAPATPTPSPAPKRAYGRNLADFGDLHPAEKILLAQCVQGEVANIGDDVPADDTDPGKVVRASFLRFLLLGGDEQAPIHEKGVQLSGAWIQGQLDLKNCFVPHGLKLEKCKFDESIIARDAHITGLLYLSGSHLRQGLRADRLRCDSSVFLRNGFRSAAEVRLSGAQIGGCLSCAGGQFEPGEKDGPALSADHVVVKGNVSLNDKFKATGEVRLLGAQIGGQLVCSGGQFEPQAGYALSADHVVVKGDVFLDEKFTATGEVRLLNAQIGGQLVCSGGQFQPKEGDALSADGAVVKGDVFLKNQFKATGTVRLPGAQIGGDLSCAGGQFEPMQGSALYIDRAVINGSVHLRYPFKATGTVQLLGAHIGGDLSCDGGQFSSHELNLQNATIQRNLFLRSMAAPVLINASYTQIGVLVDDRTAWAKGSILDGLVYRSIEALTEAAHRIVWLKQQSAEDLGEDGPKQGFRPQPWKQLQKVLHEMGHDADAREVGVAFENQLLKADRIGQITDASKAKDIIPIVRRKCLRGLHWLFGALAGYGYRRLRLFMSMVALWLFCAAVYWCLALPQHNAIGPTDPLVFQNPAYAACTAAGKGNWFLCGPLPAEYTTFSPLAYSLDILLPLVDLGQEKSWGPLVPTPEQPIYGEFSPSVQRILCAFSIGLKFFTAGWQVCFLWPLSRACLGAVRWKSKQGFTRAHIHSCS
jgi:hypothetical protein